MYGQYKYGTVQFGAGLETETPIAPYIPDLMKHLPDYWHEILEMKEIQDTAAEELGLVRYTSEDVLNQCFIKTATWGLDLWEKELGLSTDRSKPYERRREIILAKLRGAGTTTKAMIIGVAAAFSGGDVDVIEYPAEYRFEVKFIGVLGIPPNMPGLIQAIEDIKPAHLACSFTYTYTTWDMLGSLYWQNAGPKTWKELKTYGGE